MRGTLGDDRSAGAVRAGWRRARASGASAGRRGGADGAFLPRLCLHAQRPSTEPPRPHHATARDVLDVEVIKGGPRDQTAPAGLGVAVLEAA